MKIYRVSHRCYYAFGALVYEETSYKIKVAFLWGKHLGKNDYPPIIELNKVIDGGIFLDGLYMMTAYL
ncbi:hypothetical protein Pyn_16608 [Prunus yedoensis var. nudiflora]|uniref:Uncharacterized protein n=1 Tax=Prunus yedoensis var. nudiflora TaxID=2094558 RepID=A0A314U5Y6_PRUYE|nr:hypothetical protein Pyn_16608 [Prunus yedoensis var. nudiflora]